MALDDNIRALAGVRLFEGLNAEQLRLLAFGAENIRLVKGRDLYRADTAADGAFVVMAGRIALYRMENSERIVVERHGPGGVLDEMALIVSQRRPYGAFADQDGEALRITRTLFRRILDEYPEVAVALRDRIAARFLDMATRISRLHERFDPQ